MKNSTLRGLLLGLFAINYLVCNSSWGQMYSVRDSISEDGLECKIFIQPTNTKNKNNSIVSYIFVEKRTDIPLGCDIYREENGNKIPMNSFPVIAYTKDKNDRMNYNSILPYISICQAGKRVILSFECQFIVMYPDRLNEQIIGTKNLYGIITDKSIEIINH